MFRRGEEEGENVGCDPLMSLLSQPSSPSWLYGSGFEFGYEDEFNCGVSLSSPSPVPLSPLWDLSDGDHPYFSGLHNPIPRRVHHFSTLSYTYKDDHSRLDIISFWKLVEDELIWFKALNLVHNLKFDSVSSNTIKLRKSLRLVIKDYVVLRGQNNSDLTIAQTLLKFSSLAGSLYQELRSTLRDGTEFSQTYPLYLNQPQQGLVMQDVASVSISTTAEEAPPVWVLDATQLNGVCVGQNMFDYTRKLFCKNKSHRQHFSFNDNLSERAVSSRSKQVKPGLFPRATTFFINNCTDLVIDVDDLFSPLRNLALTIGHILAVAVWTETSVSAEHEIEVEQAPVFSQTDPLSLYHPQKGLVMQDPASLCVNVMDEDGGISNLDLQVQQSVLELDALEWGGGCKGETMIEHRRELFVYKKSHKGLLGSLVKLCRRAVSSHTTQWQHSITQVRQIENKLNLYIQNNLPSSLEKIEVIQSAEFQVDDSVSAEPETAVEQVPEFGRKDHLSLNQPPEVLVIQNVTSMTLKETCMHGGFAKLYEQAQQTVLELDEIEGDTGCEVQAISTVIRDKINTISSSKHATSKSVISLEDLQRHFTRTREEAAKSLGVSVSTLKRICRQHDISRWPFLKKSKKNPSPSKVKCVNVTVQDDALDGEFISQSSVTTNPTLCHAQPLLPLTPVDENRGCTQLNTYLCLNSDTIETSKQDVGSVTVEATEDCSLNKPPMILVDMPSSTVMATQGVDAIAKLDSEEQKSTVGCDAVEGGGGVCAEDFSSNTIAENQKKRTTSVSKRGSLISLEVLQQHCSMNREKAAESLGVSVSTVKRACREHGISSWLLLKRMKKYEAPSELKSMNVAEQDNIAGGSSQTSAIPVSILHAVNPVEEVRCVTVKAKYVDKTIRFDLPYLSEIVELEEQVAKRLKLEVGSFSIEYLDEDGDQILVTSSDDLRYCIDTLTSLGKTTIRMLVKLTTS